MKKIAVVGLGYVGLPLAVEFGKIRPVVGFDINKIRIEELKQKFDRTNEVSNKEFDDASQIVFDNELDGIREAQIFIITVPTPINKYKQPDLGPLLSATKSVAQVLKKGDIVIYESTVYPGCTEEDCVPLLELTSGLKFNVDFYCGYSPERINPGDKIHRLPNIKKVTSGSTPKTADEIDTLYGEIITAGTYKAPSIKVAEAAKVIENSQRDLNIAFVNELSLIFDKLNIDTSEVLSAASTKWNFLPFKPGLVGGHCIGVDPYYLTHKAESVGYHPEVILAGRRINDTMAVHVANQVLKLMVKKDLPIKGSKVLVLGITFKENCPDIRNSKVIDVIHEVESFGLEVDVYDPHADTKEVRNEYSIELVDEPHGNYQVIFLAVAHDEFKSFKIKEFCNDKSIIYDIKGFWDKDVVDKRL